MHESRRSQKQMLERLMSRYFRVTLGRAAYFLAVWLILLASEPDYRALVLGTSVVMIGMLIRVLASGYGQIPAQIVGIYRWVRYPTELGTALVLIGLAFCGKQLDIILMILMGTSFYFAYVTKKRDELFRLKAAPEYLWYEKLVSSMMPALFPISKKMLPNTSSSLVTLVPRFSIKRALLGDSPREIRQIDYIFGHLILLLVLYVSYRYKEVIPFNRLFGVGFGVYVIGHFFYFALRGDRRRQSKLRIRN